MATEAARLQSKDPQEERKKKKNYLDSHRLLMEGVRQPLVRTFAASQRAFHQFFYGLLKFKEKLDFIVPVHVNPRIFVVGGPIADAVLEGIHVLKIEHLVDIFRVKLATEEHPS